MLPPSLCADVLYYLEYRRAPRDAFRVFCKYLDNVPLPKVVVDNEVVEDHSKNKKGDPDVINGFYSKPTNTIHLKDDYEPRTAIHEFFHHLSNIRNANYDHDDIYAYADEIIERGRLLLREPE